jgi:hypothetical protein
MAEEEANETEKPKDKLEKRFSKVTKRAQEAEAKAVPEKKPAAAAKGSESFEEFSSRLDQIEKAQDVMRYGGTGGGPLSQK